MSIEIPQDSVRDFSTQTIDILVATFRIDVAWNSRSEDWWMSIFTENGDTIIGGAKLVPGWDLLGRYRDERLPAGRFFAVDTNAGGVPGAGVPPGRDDLGNRVVMVFFTDEEVDAL